MEQKEYINVDELFQNWHDKPASQPSDMAWARMHDILEKEMPQKEKRKKKWFIPLIGLMCTVGGAAIGIAATSYYFNNDSTDANTAITKTSPSEASTTTMHMPPTRTSKAIDAYAEQEADKTLAFITKASQQNNHQANNGNAVVFKPNNASARVAKSKQINNNNITQAINGIVQNNTDAQAIATILEEYQQQHTAVALNEVAQQSFQAETNKPIKLQHDLVNSTVLVASAYIKSPVGLEYIKYNNTWFKKIDAPKTFKVQHKKYEATNDIVSEDGYATITTSSITPLALANNGGGSSDNEAVTHEAVTSKTNQMNTFWEDLQIRSNPFVSWLFSSHSFNPIINAGMHYSSAFNGAMGYNLGFGVKYNLKQHIKISTLLNYQHTFLGNYIYNDHALTYNVTKNGNTYSGEEITEENYYTLKSLQQVQIPVFLNYHFVKDFYLTAGLNVSYTLPVNYNTDSYKKINDNFASLVEPEAQAAKITSTRDFNQNMGVGYILGFGYNANKRMQIDLKMQQMLYNSNIQQSYLGKDLYGKPTFNLQITYNLGKK